MSQLFHLDKTDSERFLALLCPKWAQHTKDSRYAMAAGSGGTEPGRNRQTLLHHYRRIWDLASQGIFYLHHLLKDGNLKTFDSLREEFTLLNHMFFRFLQLRHVTQSQFPNSIPHPTPNVNMAVLKSTDPHKLISAFYSMLSTPVSTKIAYKLKPR